MDVQVTKAEADACGARSTESESRIGAMDRLRSEHRWSEASGYRNEVRRKLREEGKPREEAVALAWEAMIARFPPLPAVEAAQPEEIDEEKTDSLDAEFLPVASGGNGSDLACDGIWVYEHLEDRRVQPRDAPSMGAWSLLVWARQYKSPFFERILPKVMAAKPGEHVDEGEEPALAEVEKMLKDVRAGMDAALAERLARDVPATVRELVSNRVADWAGRFQLELPDEAAASLRVEMLGLVGDCLRAAAPESRASEPTN